VSGLSETSYPISQALDGWKQGFVDTKDGKMMMEYQKTLATQEEWDAAK
jgi:hypothetical protein